MTCSASTKSVVQCLHSDVQCIHSDVHCIHSDVQCIHSLGHIYAHLLGVWWHKSFHLFFFVFQAGMDRQASSKSRTSLVWERAAVIVSQGVHCADPSERS